MKMHSCREKERQKRKEQRHQQQQERYDMLAKLSKDERTSFLQQEKRDKLLAREKLENAVEHGQKLVIDLQYDEIMSDKEINSLARQIKFSYGTIKRMLNPFALHLTSCSSRISEALHKIHCQNWKAVIHEAPVHEVFPPEDRIYLSPDATTVLEQIDPTKVYIIGGIVDRTRSKGETLATASKHACTAMRLPIQEHISDRLDHILNINTVIEILAHYQDNGDWKEALESIVPQRKQNKSRRAEKRKESQNKDIPKSCDAESLEANFRLKHE